MNTKQWINQRSTCEAAAPQDAIGSASIASCCDSKHKGFGAFEVLCGSLFDLLPKAVAMMTIWLMVGYGLRTNHFDGFFIPGYGWLVGLPAFLVIGAILLVGIMGQLAKIQRQTRNGRVSWIRALIGSIASMAMIYAVLYCAAVSLVGIEKLHSNIEAAISNHSSNERSQV